MSKHVSLIRASGSEIQTTIDRWEQIRGLIGAECLDSFSLRDGRVCVVNDLGHQNGLPLNVKATKLYHGICKPGTTHQIVGDVAIIIDAEWA